MTGWRRARIGPEFAPEEIARELFLERAHPTRTGYALLRRTFFELLVRPMAVEPTAVSAFALGVLALQRRELAQAMRLLEESQRLEPKQPAALRQFSIAYTLSRNIPMARATALRLAGLDPRYPDLAGWLSVLGITR